MDGIQSIGTTSGRTASSSSTTLGGSDYETFLKMLTVQMRNQDPMNPIDSTDYATQLATFSGVEQAVRTNQLLEELGQQFNVLGMAQLAGFVGQEARVDTGIYMDGSPVTLSPNPASAADRAVLVVKDADGHVVSREDIPVSAEPYQWLGGGGSGDPLPTGIYQLSLESYAGEDLLSTSPVEHYATITEAQGGSNGTMLVLKGGIVVPATSVTALRSP